MGIAHFHYELRSTFRFGRGRCPLPLRAALYVSFSVVGVAHLRRHADGATTTSCALRFVLVVGVHFHYELRSTFRFWSWALPTFVVTLTARPLRAALYVSFWSWASTSTTSCALRFVLVVGVAHLRRHADGATTTSCALRFVLVVGVAHLRRHADGGATTSCALRFVFGRGRCPLPLRAALYVFVFGRGRRPLPLRADGATGSILPRYISLCTARRHALAVTA